MMLTLIFLPWLLALASGSCVVDIPDCTCYTSPLDATCPDLGLIWVPRTFARLRVLRLPFNYIQVLRDEDVADLNLAVLDLRGQYTGCVKDRRTREHPILVYGLCEVVS